MAGTVRWFGKAWNDQLCTAETNIPTPVGKRCLYCKEPIVLGDDGISMPLVEKDAMGTAYYHLECNLRSILGPDHDAVRAEAKRRARRRS